MAESLATVPYWWEAATPRSLPETQLTTTSDVAVVGAGYAGLSAALVRLCQEHMPGKAEQPE